MPSGSLTAAALRHRPRQAVLLVVLAAVVSAAATLGPLYARATEQSVLRTVLSEALAQTRGATVTSSTNTPPTPSRLARSIDALRANGFGAAIGGAETGVTVGKLSRPGASGSVTASLTSRTGLCRHLELTDGECFAATAADGGVLVSQRNAEAFDISPGDQLSLTDLNDSKVGLTATVTGIYRAFDASGGYWFGRRSTATIPPPRQNEAAPTVLDTVYTSWPTLHAQPFSQVRTHVDVPLRLDGIDLGSMAAVRAGARAIDAQARTLESSSVTGLTGLVAASNSQRRQARTVIPLLAIQLAVLGVVVLGFVCAAASEARRPEIALARLRGQRSGGAAALLLRELGLLTVIGAIVGAVAGWFVAGFAAGRWLAPGVQLELRWPVFAAAAAAAAAGLLAVLVTAAPTLRQPLTSLLRRVPPRASALQVGLVEGALVAAAAAGEVTLLASSGTSGADSAGASQSPVALLAPGLLALAGGLLLAQVVVPVAGPLAKRALRRGRVTSALAGTQVARRPALRRLIAIITVACALLVFAVDTWQVADRNRVARAGVEAGAPVVLTVDAKNAGKLRDAVLAIDPNQRYATPVVTATSAAEGGPRTTAVEPAAFARIARWGSDDRRPAAAMLRKLAVDTVPALRVTGEQVRLRARARFTGVSSDLNGAPPEVRPMHIIIKLLAIRDGHPVAVELPTALKQGRADYVSAVPCTGGCLLRGVEILRDFGDFDGVDLHFAVEQLSVGPEDGAGTDVDLGPVSQATWQPVPDDYGQVATVDPKHPISFALNTFGGTIGVQRGDVPVSSPALYAGNVLDRHLGPTFPDPPALAPDLTGVEASYEVAGHIAMIPRTGSKGVLTNLALLDRSVPPTTQTSYAVWLARDDPPREHRLVTDLERRAILVTARDSIGQHENALATEGPTLALRLAVLAGVVALVLAAFVLVVGVATSSVSRARDLAGLRLVGVPARVIRAAAIREHVTVALLGTVCGVILGLVAAQAALPRLPLFARPGPDLPISHGPAWSSVALASAACLVLLVTVSVFVGRMLAASATPDRLRQDR